MSTITRKRPLVGCDPELFVRSQETGRIIASKDIVGGGVKGYFEYFTYELAPDGVQVEFHPSPGDCLAASARSIRGCFVRLNELLLEKKAQADFTQTIELTDEEFEALPEEARQLGCQPSKNIYGDRDLGVPADCRKRSAGGHIHLGLTDVWDVPELMTRRQDIVPLLDVLLGIPATLLDRDPNAAVRRQVYGRAGEFRLPSYGLEYRTLSNFWLRAFPLTNFVWQQARVAVSVAALSMESQGSFTGHGPNGKPQYTVKPPQKNFAGELCSLVDFTEVQEAINTSNFDLSMKIFLKIQNWIEENIVSDEENDAYGRSFPLTKTTIPDFLFLVEKGLDFFLKTEPMEHWLTLKRRGIDNEGCTDAYHTQGWLSFLIHDVRPIRLKEEEKKAEAAKIQTLLVAGREEHPMEVAEK